MNLDTLTFGEIKELANFFCRKEELEQHPYAVGKSYLIRTVTFTYVGKLKSVFKNELILENASWCADTGRFNECLKNGLESSITSEIEPYSDDVIISRGAIVDATEYKHPLPTKAK